MSDDLSDENFAFQEDIMRVVQKIYRKDEAKKVEQRRRAEEHGPDGRADGKSVVGKVFVVIFH